MALLNITNFFPHSFLQDSNSHHSLGEEISLCENGNMVFHWADFYETCDAIRGQMENNLELKEDFENRERGLQRLSLIPIWIKTESKVHQTTMYDIYERYILDHSHMVSGLNPFGSISISFISGTGPFKSMALTECLNHTTYRDFVLVNLLRGQLPKRDFRVRLKSKILVEFGRNFTEGSLINLEQITTHGLLLSLNSDLFAHHMIQEEKVRLLIDTKILEETSGKSLRELSEHLKPYAFNLLYSSRKEDAIEVSVTDFKVQSSFDFIKNKKSYLFISFETLKVAHPKSERIMKNFIDYSRELVRGHYRVLGSKVSA